MAAYKFGQSALVSGLCGARSSDVVLRLSHRISKAMTFAIVNANGDYHMTRIQGFTLPVALGVLLAGAATAQEISPAIDVNGDGMYSFPELQTAMPELSDADFTVLDASGDGLLEAAEVAAAVEAGLMPAMDG